jgi:NlpC/P60 family
MLAMRIWLLPTIMLACSLSWAAPKRQPAQDIEQFLVDAGVITQIEQLRQNVSDTASGLVVNAMGLLGVPYRAGGTSEATGFDCSGFVRTIFERSIGLVLPRRAKDQAEVTQNVEVKDLKPGDLVFYHTLRQAFSHVGIYIGDGKFIHSPRPGHQVRIEDMRDAYWAKRFDGARRVKELNASGMNVPASNAAPVGVGLNGGVNTVTNSAHNPNSNPTNTPVGSSVSSAVTTAVSTAVSTAVNGLTEFPKRLPAFPALPSLPVTFLTNTLGLTSSGSSNTPSTPNSPTAPSSPSAAPALSTVQGALPSFAAPSLGLLLPQTTAGQSSPDAN